MPLPQTLINSLKLDSNNIFYNDIQIQNINSILCGYFAMAFLKSCSTGNINNRISNFLKMFSNDTKNNDKIIKNYFLSYNK
jgi:hypothetical protein